MQKLFAKIQYIEKPDFLSFLLCYKNVGSISFLLTVQMTTPFNKLPCFSLLDTSVLANQLKDVQFVKCTICEAAFKQLDGIWYVVQPNTGGPPDFIPILLLVLLYVTPLLNYYWNPWIFNALSLVLTSEIKSNIFLKV